MAIRLDDLIFIIIHVHIPIISGGSPEITIGITLKNKPYLIRIFYQINRLSLMAGPCKINVTDITIPKRLQFFTDDKRLLTFQP